MIVSGNPVTKELKSCFAEVMNQLGPKQLQDLKKLGLSTENKEEEKKEETEKPKVDFQAASEEKK